MSITATPIPIASPGSRLRALAGAAIIGTDRSAGACGVTTPAQLLTLAAVCGTRARAGIRPTKVDAAETICPADPLPAASDRAMSVLNRILTDADAGLIEEWAGLALARSVRVSDDLAPLVLEWWSRQQRRSEAVWRVLGVRGAWLASLNPAWKKAVAAAGVPEDLEQVWETGTVAERAAVLTALRRVDPARGLALVRSTWNSDGADARQKFLECLAEGCSTADEEFLESCLDDRSKVVRRQAAAVLGPIAGSRYRQRADARAAALIRVEKGGLLKGKSKVALSPPAEFDTAWERDGIEEKAPGGLGPRAWWLRQILEAADPEVWLTVTGLEPRRVLEALAGDDYAKDAIAAIGVSTMRSRHAGWSGEFLHQASTSKRPPLDEIMLYASVQPQADAETTLLEIAAHDRATWPEKWLILAGTGRPWSAGYSERALTMLKAYQPKKVESHWIYEGADRVSRVVAPAAADLFEEVVLANCTHQPSDSVKKSLIRVRLRAEMHKELA